MNGNVKIEDKHTPGRKTSRDALVIALGDAHASHTVMAKRVLNSLEVIEIHCSCGSKGEVAATREYRDALRNVYVPTEKRA